MDTRDRVLTAATRLFAAKGYDGASVRQICRAAKVSDNALHYHFGSKEKLLRALVDGFTDTRTRAAKRILSTPAADPDELVQRLRLFSNELWGSLAEEPDLVRVLYDVMDHGPRRLTKKAMADFRELGATLARFIEQARASGLIRPSVDAAVFAGTLFERVVGQVRYAGTISALYPEEDPAAYRARWIDAQLDILCFGLFQGSAGAEKDTT